MSRISEKVFKKIAENALAFLYEQYPLAISTAKIADELARDNEFTLRIMKFLQEKGLVLRLSEGRHGAYSSWNKWKMSPAAYKKYSSTS